METPNYRKASIYFDDETVLEVTQRGGGGSGVGGETGLEAVNLITGESTNDALAEQAETIEQQAATIETQAGTIEEQEATIETQAATIIEKDAAIAEKDATIATQAATIEDLQRTQIPIYGFNTISIQNNSAASVGVMITGAFINGNLRIPYILDTNVSGGMIAPNSSSSVIPGSDGNRFYVGRDDFYIFYETSDNLPKTITVTASGGGGVSVTQVGAGGSPYRVAYKQFSHYKVTPGSVGSGGGLTIAFS